MREILGVFPQQHLLVREIWYQLTFTSSKSPDAIIHWIINGSTYERLDSGHVYPTNGEALCKMWWIVRLQNVVNAWSHVRCTCTTYARVIVRFFVSSHFSHAFIAGLVRIKNKLTKNMKNKRRRLWIAGEKMLSEWVQWLQRLNIVIEYT